jgi:uncharacterized membrane protein
MNAERFRTLVSLVLATGVAVSAVLLGAGLAGALAIGWHGSLIGLAHATRLSTTDFGDLPARLSALEPAAVVQLGLLTLLATPVVRVAVSVGAFALERDRLYTAITLTVLLILVAGIFFLR